MLDMKKIVVLTGSGISAESGLKTFRDSGGLWEEYDVMEVASIEGWMKNRELVLGFYNDRRAQLEKAKPNEGHKILAELENYFDVQIITQNVDNLHEKAGSSNVLHLHGELTKVRSTEDEKLIYDVGTKQINIGDTCEKGHQLRPHIVWFGEPVPLIPKAIDMVLEADFFVVIGTSLEVYPAAGLIDYVKLNVPIFLIDPNEVRTFTRKVKIIKSKASEGAKQLKTLLLEMIK